MSNNAIRVRYFIFVAALLHGFTHAGAAAGAGDWTNVRIANAGDFEPWIQTDASGQLTGFEIDLAKDLCARMGIECEFITTAWDGIFDGLEAGHYDAIMAAVSTTEERQKRFNFSHPYACGGVKFAVPKDSPLVDYAGPMEWIELTEIKPDEQLAIDDLKRVFESKVVGAPAKTIHTQFLEKYMADQIEIRPYEEQADLDGDLAAGRLDAALSAMSHWITAIEEGADLVLVGPRLSGGVFGQGVGVVVRKDNGDLADMFSQAISTASKDGKLDELVQRWFGYDASC
jgi:octopine/nopaline transport system substrate-binding protein